MKMLGNYLSRVGCDQIRPKHSSFECFKMSKSFIFSLIYLTVRKTPAKTRRSLVVQTIEMSSGAMVLFLHKQDQALLLLELR